MAPTTNLEALVRRQYYGNYYDYGYNSSWNNWGRWVALVAIILFVLFIALAFSCVNARRRRRQGLAPRYGTGWAAGKTPMGHNAPQYNGQYSGQTYPAPPYAPPVNNNYTGNSNDGFYGNQQNGYELQQPQNTYYPPRGNEQFSAPAGPPPGKNGDGIIR